MRRGVMLHPFIPAVPFPSTSTTSFSYPQSPSHLPSTINDRRGNSHQVCSQSWEVLVLQVLAGIPLEELIDQRVLNITYHADRWVDLC